jgi:hypothetical protein
VIIHMNSTFVQKLRGQFWKGLGVVAMETPISGSNDGINPIGQREHRERRAHLTTEHMGRTERRNPYTYDMTIENERKMPKEHEHESTT